SHCEAPLQESLNCSNRDQSFGMRRSWQGRSDSPGIACFRHATPRVSPVDDATDDFVADRFAVSIRCMLCGQHDVLYLRGFVVLIADGDLRLCVAVTTATRQTCATVLGLSVKWYASQMASGMNCGVSSHA